MLCIRCREVTVLEGTCEIACEDHCGKRSVFMMHEEDCVVLSASLMGGEGVITCSASQDLPCSTFLLEYTATSTGGAAVILTA